MNCKRTLLALVITVFLLSPVQAMSATGENRIEGTWVVRVNLNEANLPPFFTALETYGTGGTFITSNNLPFLTKVGQGTWEKQGQQYAVSIVFFKFDENGLPTGTIKVRHTLTLNGKNEYFGSGTALFCEADGTTCQSVAFDTEGRRLNTQP